MTSQVHSPLLVNEEATSWAKRFGANEDLYALWCHLVDDVMLHDHVKLRLPNGETFWVEICLRSSNYWMGIVRSQIESVKIAPGDLLRFSPLNVYAIMKQEVEK